MISGLLDLPWWGYVLYTLVLTHITIASITIFLHRHQAQHHLRRQAGQRLERQRQSLIHERGAAKFLHRHQAHRALELHSIPSHFFRFWLWLTTGMVTKEWTAIHRKHHAKCETSDDPHSPQILSIGKVVKEGSELYRKEAKNMETIERYGHGTPDDWLERKIYSKHSKRILRAINRNNERK